MILSSLSSIILVTNFQTNKLLFGWIRTSFRRSWTLFAYLLIREIRDKHQHLPLSWSSCSSHSMEAKWWKINVSYWQLTISSYPLMWNILTNFTSTHTRNICTRRTRKMSHCLKFMALRVINRLPWIKFCLTANKMSICVILLLFYDHWKYW